MTRRLFSYSVSISIQLWLFMLFFGLITIEVMVDLMDCAQQDIRTNLMSFSYFSFSPGLGKTGIYSNSRQGMHRPRMEFYKKTYM